MAEFRKLSDVEVVAEPAESAKSCVETETQLCHGRCGAA